MCVHTHTPHILTNPCIHINKIKKLEDSAEEALGALKLSKTFVHWHVGTQKPQRDSQLVVDILAPCLETAGRLLSFSFLCYLRSQWGVLLRGEADVHISFIMKVWWFSCPQRLSHNGSLVVRQAALLPLSRAQTGTQPRTTTPCRCLIGQVRLKQEKKGFH